MEESWPLVLDGLILTGVSLLVLLAICLRTELRRFWRRLEKPFRETEEAAEGQTYGGP